MRSLKPTGAAVVAAAAAGARVPGQKKSCDLCVFRKRKCDGVMPSCGFCQSRGTKCHYSLRRPNRPRGYSKRPDGGEEQQLVLQGEAKPRSMHGPGEEENCGMEQRQQEPPPIGWKRLRLSASPATGLVGTKENAFLGSFFSCLGFLPMTHERLIRATLVEVMLGSPSTPENVDYASGARINAVKTGKFAGASDRNEEQGRADAASTCALWCTIAMGALVQGQPPEQVAPYMHHAWTSLSQCFDTVTVESGRAFLMMAYLHNFMRDDHKFHRYLQHARRVVNRLPERTVQKQEIDDLVMMGDDTRIFHTAALEPSELDAYCTDASPALEVPGVVRKSDLCRLLLQADRRMMKAFLRDHRAQAASPPDLRNQQASPVGKTESMTSEGRNGSGKDMDVYEGQCGYLSGLSIKVDGIPIDSTKIGEDASPSRPADETWKCTEEARKVFTRLEEAVEAPEIRTGVGSLLYNSVLGYLDMVTGSTELEAGFEKVKHCAEVISRYPGLCRFSTWRHLSHCLLSFLCKLGEVNLYEELRQAYNSVRAEDAPDAPPHTEWSMMGFCDHIFCRSMDHQETIWGGLSATETLTVGSLEEQPWLSEYRHWLHDTYENNNHWASLAPEYHSSTAILGQAFPTHKWTDVMLPFPADASTVSAQHSHYMPPAPGFHSVGPLSVAGMRPVSPTTGQTPAVPPGRGEYDGTSVRMDTRTHGYAQNSWHSASSSETTNASWVSHGAGAIWPLFPSFATANSTEMTASTAQRVLGEKAVHHMTGGGAWNSPRTGEKSTSEMGGADGGGVGTA